MGLFSPSQKELEELEEIKKYCETVYCGSKNDIDKTIVERIKAGKKIKDFKITSQGDTLSYIVTFLYDYNPFEEKLAKEKESNDLGR